MTKIPPRKRVKSAGGSPRGGVANQIIAHLATILQMIAMRMCVYMEMTLPLYEKEGQKR
jgi:hypothetical protein